MHKHIKLGKHYRFDPVMFDVLSPPFDAAPGDIVYPVNMPGCPKAGTMGMCHIKRVDNDRFAGMVCLNSLKPV